jgi:hypothetical protein
MHARHRTRELYYICCRNRSGSMSKREEERERFRFSTFASWQGTQGTVS